MKFNSMQCFQFNTEVTLRALSHADTCVHDRDDFYIPKTAVADSKILNHLRMLQWISRRFRVFKCFGRHWSKQRCEIHVQHVSYASAEALTDCRMYTVLNLPAVTVIVLCMGWCLTVGIICSTLHGLLNRS